MQLDNLAVTFYVRTACRQMARVVSVERGSGFSEQGGSGTCEGTQTRTKRSSGDRVTR